MFSKVDVTYHFTGNFLSLVFTANSR